VGLSRSVETAFFKHLFSRYYDVCTRFAYWRGKKDEEVDIVAEVKDQVIPFEVKYRYEHTGAGDLKGIIRFCAEKKVSRGYVITREMDDFSIMPLEDTPAKARLLKIAAPLACFLLGQAELQLLHGR